MPSDSPGHARDLIPGHAPRSIHLYRDISVIVEPPASPPGVAQLGLRDPYARDERSAASPVSGDPYVAYAPIPLRPNHRAQINSIAQLHQFNSLNFTMFPSVTILRQKYLDIFRPGGKARTETRDHGYRGTKVGRSALARPRADAALTAYGEPGQVIVGTRGARDGPTLPGCTDGLWV